MKRRWWIFIVAIASAARAAEEGPSVEPAPPPPASNWSGRGLLDLKDTFPLADLHLQVPVNTLLVLEEGRGKLDARFYWTNAASGDGSFVVDAETYRLELGGWYALRDDFYLGLELPILARSGGVLDPVVDGFHDLFGFHEPVREDRPQNEHEVSVTESGVTHDLETGAGLGDLVLKSHWNLTGGDRWFPAVSLEALVTIPTSMPGFGANAPDLGLVFSFHKRVLRWLHLHGGVGGTYYLKAETEGFPFESFIAQAAGGVEIRPIESFSIIFQAMTLGPLMERPSPLDESRNYMAGGIKWEFHDGIVLEISVLENIAPFENTADVTFFAGFSFLLGEAPRDGPGDP